MKSVRFVLFLGCSLSLFAQNPKPNFDDWENICKETTTKPVIEPRFSGPLGPAQLAKCDSEALYYGFGSKPDYAAALQCAWYERAHSDAVVADMNRGVGVLTMLYANGRGTPKDIALAMRFACEEQWAAPAEMSGRLEHLNSMKDSRSQDPPFDMCDDITSGLNMDKCTDIQQRFADVERDKKLAAITAKLTPAQRRLYDKVHAAEIDFEITRTGSEIDLSGTAHGMFSALDRAKLEDQFLINLQRFSKEDIPEVTAADAKELDAQMNTLYQRIMRAPENTFSLGTVKPDGIRDTQRSWLKLRDAWLEFAKSAYPRLTTDRVTAQLIRLRLNQLRLLPIDLK